MVARYRSCSRVLASRAPMIRTRPLRLGVYDDYEAAIDWADRDESVLSLGMVVVKDLQILSTRFEELPRLRERQAVLLLVAEILLVVPLGIHKPGAEPLA